MPDTILVLNAGSSSIKFQLFAIGGGERLERRLKGQIDGIGADRPHLTAGDAAGGVRADRALAPTDVADVARAQTVVDTWLREHMEGPPIGVGHRVVHGGPDFTGPVLIDDAVLDRLQGLVPLAPLHQPNNLAPIRAIRDRAPELPQVACFDTSFHRTHPEIADRFAIPQALYEAGIRRYGFHGLSYEYIASRLPEVAPEIAPGRVIVAHLGSGASMCALHAGRSMESTMSFTALDGLPMGTRTGQIDPGVILYLLAEKGMDGPALERLLYHESGLKGLSGVGSDVRQLLASTEPGAKLALGYLTNRLAFFIGGLAATLGGVDGIVFTAGIGENAAAVRAAVCERCAWLGVELAPDRNDAHALKITAEASRLPVYVIPTDEERMIAKHTLGVLRTSGT